MPDLNEAEIRRKINDGSILRVSVDTAVFDRYKCNLQHPVLARLDQFKKGGVKLLLSEVVVREIRSHISDAAQETQRRLKTTLRNHENTWKLGHDRDEVWRKFQINVDPINFSKEQVDKYLESVGADIVPVVGKGNLSAEVFRRYFDLITPFENKESKKHEFPDAFALLSLEEDAAENKTLILCVSPDKGWSTFAKQSRHLVVVQELEVALSWFNEPEKLLADKVIALWTSGAAAIVEGVNRAFEYYLDGVPLEVECTAPLYYEHELLGAVMQNIYFDQLDEPIVIASDDEEVTLAVKVVARVQFEVRFDFHVRDYVDGDVFFMTGDEHTCEKDVVFDVTITVSRDMEGNEIEIIDVIVNSGRISVDFGYVEPFPDDSSEPDDDL